MNVAREASMAESASGGWQTVLASAHNHNRVEHRDRALLTAYERQALETWAKIEGDWSGWYVLSFCIRLDLGLGEH